MKVEDVYQFFGSANKASKAIGIVRATFSVWVRNGYIPFRKQQKIESITKGKLIAKHEDSINPVNYGIEALQPSYFPMFRYFDGKHGMCDVESIHFRKGKCPKITYKVVKNTTQKLSSFDPNFLMQGFNIKDCEEIILFEGDICLTNKGEKITFDSIYKVGKFNKISSFKIIGNIFEGEFNSDNGRNDKRNKDINQRRLQKRSRKSH